MLNIIKYPMIIKKFKIKLNFKNEENIKLSQEINTVLLLDTSHPMKILNVAIFKINIPYS